MANSFDAQRLLSGFLMEAWEGLAGLEQSVKGLATPHAATAIQKLKLLGHRMNGSAALYGFPHLASLSEKLEATAHRIDPEAPERSPNALAAFDASLKLIPEVLDRIAQQGDDQHPALPGLIEQYAALSSTPAGASDQALSEDEGTNLALEGTGRFAGVDRELQSFRRLHSDVLEYYLPEAEEHLEVIANSLSQLEVNDGHRASLSELFRSIHTLKGAAFTVGCDPMGRLAHSMEDLMVEIRNDRRKLDGSALKTLHAASDVLRASLSRLRGANVPLEADYEATAASLLAWLGDPVETAVEEPVDVQSEEPTTSQPVSELEREPRDESATLASPQPPGSPAKGEVSRSAHSMIRVDINRMDRLLNLVGELVVARRRFELELDDLERIDEQMTTSRSRMVDTVQDFEEKYLNPVFDSSSSQGDPPEAKRQAGSPAAFQPLTPVDQVPLDELFDELEFDRYDDFNVLSRRVGEISADLREAHAEIQESIKTLRQEAHQLRQLTLDLRDGISRARMVPIGQLYGRFRRLLRKLEGDSGKQVQMVATGEAVEVDNAIIERIVDPLMHLIQNAVSHGIESPEERRAKGKPSQGTIHLNAYPRGNFVYLEVKDDGAGIDIENLKRLAEASGYRSLEELATLDDQQALQLIYLPGLSTSAELTTSAGRGVGMDVVLNNISSLNGEIEIETEQGTGTRFTLKLPLTLLISEALIVRLGDFKFGIPSPAISRLLHVRPETLKQSDDGYRIQIGDDEIDVLWLEQLFEVPSRRESDEIPIALIRGAGRDFALAVDEHLVIEEIVIKNLGTFLEGLDFFAGATISGEGQVIPLLDTLALATLGLATLGSDKKRPVSAEARPIHVEPAELSRAHESGGILLVDDSLSVRKIVGSMLEAEGLKVTTAGDGVEAIEAIRKQTFDLVLTDLEMPRLNGYELIEHLRRLPATRSLPIVVITSRAGSKHSELARRLGATEYLTKPVVQEDLIQRLRALLPTDGTPELDSGRSGP